MRAAALAQSAPVELHWGGRVVSLKTAAQQDLQEQALKILQSSNFNSGSGDFLTGFTFPEVQRSYRETAAGSYLLVTFPTPQRIHTVGGDITVSEIILGLNRAGGAFPLFTTGPSAPIMLHGKYAGDLCVEMLTAIKRLTNDA